MNSQIGVADSGVWGRVLIGSRYFHARPSTDFLVGYAEPKGASLLCTFTRTRTPSLIRCSQNRSTHDLPRREICPRCMIDYIMRPKLRPHMWPYVDKGEWKIPVNGAFS